MANVEKVIEQGVERLAHSLKRVAGEEPYLQEAAVKMAFRNLCWAALDADLITNFDLADHLETMVLLVREHKGPEDRAEG